MPFTHLASLWSARAAIRHALADWHARGLLLPEAARQAWADTEPDAAAWRRWLDRALLLLGVALLCGGVIVFFAFNWQALHRWTRFGLLGALVVALAAYAWRRPDRDLRARSALFAAQIASGLLLAVVGQVYQTGADAWQWFAWWASLSVPWALAARAAPHWWLVFALLNAALMRWFSIRLGAGGAIELLFGMTGGKPVAMVLMAAALGQLVIWLGVARLQPGLGMRGNAGPRALSLLASAHATALALAALFAREFDPGMLGVSLLALTLLGGWFWVGRFDIVALSGVSLALIGIAVAAVGRLVFESNRDMSGFLLLGLLTICLSAAAATWLTRLHRRHATPAAAATATNHRAGAPSVPSHAVRSVWRQLASTGAVSGNMPEPVDSPWAVRLLTGLAGWLGAVFFLLFLVGAVFMAAREDGLAMALCGLGLIALAALLYWRRAGHTGAEQFALASSLTGQGLGLYGCADTLGGARAIESAGFWLAAAAAQTVLYAVVANRLHRFLSAGSACGALALSVAIAIALGEPDRWQAIVWSLVLLAPLALASCALFTFAEPRLAAGTVHRSLGPAIDALLLCGLIGALAVTGMSHPLGLIMDDATPIAGAHWLAGAAVGVLFVCGCAAECRRLGIDGRHTLVALLAATVVAALMTGAPGVIAGVLAVGLGLRRASPAWLAVGMATIALGFVWYYSALHWTLPIKSATLVAAGIVVLLLRSRVEPRSRASGVTTAAVTEGGR